jgi:hypothetical protein
MINLFLHSLDVLPLNLLPTVLGLTLIANAALLIEGNVVVTLLKVSVTKTICVGIVVVLI